MISSSESEFEMSYESEGLTNVNGIYFCQVCKNVLVPTKANGRML